MITTVLDYAGNGALLVIVYLLFRIKHNDLPHIYSELTRIGEATVELRGFVQGQRGDLRD